MTGERRYRRAESTATVEHDEMVFVLHAPTSRVSCLTGVGAEIWRGLDESADADGLADRLLSWQGAPVRPELVDVVDRFLGIIVGLGIAEAIDPAGDSA